MRFGAKHNDIFPILSDMIRWKTGLPSRRDGQSAEAKASMTKGMEAAFAAVMGTREDILGS
jgi:hypothetical protein